MRGWSGLWCVVLALGLGACGPVFEPDDAGALEAGPRCLESDDCDDGIFCNGPERCIAGLGGSWCWPGEPPCTGLCDEGGGGCGDCSPADADRDGHAALGCGGDDCDDSDARRHPGALEVCDAAVTDEDCVPSTVGFRDDDGDGETLFACCNEGPDGLICGGDCDDDDPARFPLAPELCDGRDQDCDGVVDEDAGVTCRLYGASAATCRAGVCVLTACAADRASCDGIDENGCEGDLRNDSRNCGGCGLRCAEGEACLLGRCAPTPCELGTHACDGACLPDDSPWSCGARCEPCPTIDGADAECMFGECTLRCRDGWPLRIDAMGMPTCSPEPTTRIYDVAVTSETDTLTLLGPPPTARVTSDTITLSVHITGPSDDVWVRIGSELRQPGESFPPRVLLPGGAVVVIELVRDGVVLQRASIDLHFGLAPRVLTEGDLSDGFGTAVAIHGGRIVVGAPLEDSGASTVNGDRLDESVAEAGAAYIYERVGTEWILAAYLKPPDPVANGQFGAAVAISGDTVVVGARGATGIAGEVQAGGAYVFSRGTDGWQFVSRLVPPSADAYDWYGTAVAIDGRDIAVGAPQEDGSPTLDDPADDSRPGSGAVYLFDGASGSWTFDAYIKTPGSVRGQFGRDVRLAGGTLFVDEQGSDLLLFARDGAAWRYDRSLSYLAPSSSGREMDVDASGTRVSTNIGPLRIWHRDSTGWPLLFARTESASALAVEPATLLTALGTRVLWSTWADGAYSQPAALETAMVDSVPLAAVVADLDGGIAVLGAQGGYSSGGFRRGHVVLYALDDLP